MRLVVDASVGLKWVLQEPDSDLARRLLQAEPDLLVPHFWLHEVINVLWVQVRKRIFSPEEAQEALSSLLGVVRPTPTARMNLHDVALAIGLATDHSPYDTMYVAFALAMGASTVVVSDSAFVRNMRRHPDPAVAGMLLPLADWTANRPG